MEPDQIDMMNEHELRDELRKLIARLSPVRSDSLLDAIRKAWKEYNEINADYTYSLEEGADTDYTRRDVSNAWSKLNALIASNTDLSGAASASDRKEG